jgi:hypothetical protein
MPTEKTQPSCPGSRDLNWTGKGLMGIISQIISYVQNKISVILVVFRNVLPGPNAIKNRIIM